MKGGKIPSVNFGKGKSVFGATDVAVGGRLLRPGAWTPDNLGAALEAWWTVDPAYVRAASDGSGSEPTIGTAIGFVADKSGNGHHLMQSVSASKPILRQDARGNYKLKFDGADDFLVTSSSPAPAVTVVAAGNHQATDSVLIGFAGAVNQYAFGVINGRLYVVDNTAPTADAPYSPDGENHVFATYMDGQSETRLDGSAFANALLDGVTGEIYVGRRSNASPNENFLTGDFYGSIIANTRLSSADRSQAESYMGKLSGVAI